MACNWCSNQRICCTLRVSLKLTLNFILSLFFSIALRIATAHDFRVIRVRTWARARTKRKSFPQIKLDIAK